MSGWGFTVSATVETNGALLAWEISGD